MATQPLSNVIDPPPRLTGDAGQDTVAVIQWLNAFYVKGILSGGLLQPQNMAPALISLGALPGAADMLAYYTAEDTFDLTGFTAFARTLLDDADADAARVTLGAGDVNGPGSSTDNHVAVFDGATGKLLKDGGAPAGDVVGPAGAVDGNVVLFDTTTGKLIKDGGTLGSAAFTSSAAYQPADSQLSSIAALADAAGWLHNDGAGSFAYSTPTASDVGSPSGSGTSTGTNTGDQASLWGTGAGGAISNLTDADSNATTIAQTGTLSATTNRTFRATGNITLSQAVTVGKQNGSVRGSFPTTHGSPGVDLGAVMATIGSKGIPAPIRPGGGTAAMMGGVVQFLSGGTVSVGGAITAAGTNAASEGGGGGGLVVIIAKTAITGSSAIDVSGAAGGATGSGRGGAGSYSGAPGGHAGIGGSAGGGLTAGTGAGGAGIIPGNVGGNIGGSYAGGGGGSLDNAGANAVTVTGGAGGAGDNLLSRYTSAPTILAPGAIRATVATSANGDTGTGGGGAVAGTGGTNGGGGGGSGGAFAGSGAGGAAAALSGSGGGAGQLGSGAGGAGGSGSPDLYVLSSTSIYAGGPGGMGGGGAGASGSDSGTPFAAGGTGAAAPSLAKMGIPAGMGNGIGGVGADGHIATSAGAYLNHGGGGGAGGNGGGAAGLVLLIAPSVTYSGTVTGKLVVIDGTAALNFIQGYLVS